MKLNTRYFRHLSPTDWRVLQAVELGSKNHELVPTALIIQFSKLKTGSNAAQKSIATLARADLIAKMKNAKYDGYRLTYGGYDYLALHAHVKSGAIVHMGSQVGVGKESDIYLVTAPATRAQGRNADGSKPVQSILKIHRLGRTSFRSLARNRAYHGSRQHCTWQYLSRLSAQKEYLAMEALQKRGFPVPQPIAWNRHTVVMSLVPGTPLRQVAVEAFDGISIQPPQYPASERMYEPTETGRSGGTEVNGTSSVKHAYTNGSSSNDVARLEHIAALYSDIMELSLDFAAEGLIHGDFNEFNLLIENVPDFDQLEEVDASEGVSSISNKQSKPLKPYVIDFPQITSMSHPMAASYFERDISCIQSFFEKKYHFVSESVGPTFDEAVTRMKTTRESRKAQGGMSNSKGLDVEIEAAGFSRKMTSELETYFAHTDEGPVESEEHESVGKPFEQIQPITYSSWQPETLDSPLRDAAQSDLQLGEDQYLQAPLGLVAGESPQHYQESINSKLDGLNLGISRENLNPPKAAAGWAI